MQTTPLINLSITLSERTDVFLRVQATIRNLSRHIPFFALSQRTSFEIRDKESERPWCFFGLGGEGTSKKRINPLTETSWETILPISRDYALAHDDLAYSTLSTGHHTLQLHCYIDWVVSTGVYSEPERSAILSDYLIPSVDSNIIEFQ
jgi:hypothetical protein